MEWLVAWVWRDLIQEGGRAYRSWSRRCIGTFDGGGSRNDGEAGAGCGNLAGSIYG